MLCKNCGTPNVEGAVKCLQCGQVLDLIQSGNFQMPTMQERINNWLIPAIFTTVCCCLPFGIVAIIFAAQVNSKLQAGDYNGAKTSADKAKFWTILGIALGLVFVVIYSLFGMIAGFSNGFFKATM